MNRSVYRYSIECENTESPELRIAFNEILDQLVDILSLREKVLLSNLPDGRTSLLKRFLIFQVQCKFLDQWINEKLVIDYSVKSGQKRSDKNELAIMIVDELCRKLRDTCRLRVVN